MDAYHSLVNKLKESGLMQFQARAQKNNFVGDEGSRYCRSDKDNYCRVAAVIIIAIVIVTII